MGNSSSKDSRHARAASDPRHAAHAARGNAAAVGGEDGGMPPQSRRADIGAVPDVYSVRITGSHDGRGGSGGAIRQEIPLFLTHRRERDIAALREESQRPRETRQEREARKVEKERQLRLKERERSLREEGVDGGFLVTLGTYTGPEDFSKGIVRQLQIERRMAPFWKGLNDHSDSWTEHQLVAAVRGLPIPAPDEIPPEMSRTGSQQSGPPRISDVNVNSLTVPISSRSQSYESSTSANLSASHPAFTSGNAVSSTAQLLRGRAKTLASLATGSKSQSPDMTPQEIQLPKDPYVNGTRVEAILYKDASECPICFLYYPPYLNKTRCCDQPICSECFVQIKRPDPHPPEHEQPGQPRPPEEEAETLVSEVAACPFCVTPEFGVTYDPPPFRRGLSYIQQNNALRSGSSAMSSSTSLHSSGAASGGRRRATSLSANAPQVITTDRVRPDWAKKLADARAHALRRSAAATALHNAAYVLGNQSETQLRGLSGFGRRRRITLVETPNASGSGTPQPEGTDGDSDLYPDRGSSRRNRNRVEDLEELMMMEAIRLSLAAEEERKRKEEKELRKDAKRREKEAKKEAKQTKRNGGSSGGMYHAGTNDSTSTWASTTNMARSSSNLGFSTQTAVQEEDVQGKGKAPAAAGTATASPTPVQDFAGFHPLSEPTSTLNAGLRDSSTSSSPFAPSPTSSTFIPSAAQQDPQRHLEESRANLQPSTTNLIPSPGQSSPNLQHHLRQSSYASSADSSINDSTPSSPHVESSNLLSLGSGSAEDIIGEEDEVESSEIASSITTPAALSSTPIDDSASATPAASAEPMLNFRSLTAAVVGEDLNGRVSSQAPKEGSTAEHVEHTPVAAAAVMDGSDSAETNTAVLTAINENNTLTNIPQNTTLESAEMSESPSVAGAGAGATNSADAASGKEISNSVVNILEHPN